MPNELAAYAMWNDATSDLDAEQHRREYVAAKVAVANLWPFLAVASSEDEFGNRLSLVAAQIEAATPPALRAEVVAGLHQDYTAMCAQQAAQERQQALSVTASANQPVPESYVHVQTRDGYWQVDRIEREQVTTLGRTASLDVAYEAAREQGMPVYADGAFLGLPPVQASQEFYDAESGRWVHLANKQGAFTPDPTDAWRYSHYPPTPPQPGFGGSPAGPDDIPAQSSIGPDGFPLDLGVGEQRTPEAYARQTTPGAWAVPPGGGWRDDARNNAATGLPQGQHISSRHGRAVRAHTPGVPHTAADDPDEWSDSNWLHDHGTSDFYGGDTGQADYVKCPDCGEQRARPGRSCPGCGSQATAKISVRHTAEEGVRPPSGNPYAPNPNYFSMGTDKTGPPTFPEDPAAEPKVDNNIDDLLRRGAPATVLRKQRGLGRWWRLLPDGRQDDLQPVPRCGHHQRRREEFVVPHLRWRGPDLAAPQGVLVLPAGHARLRGRVPICPQAGRLWVITQKGTGKVLSHHDSEEDAKSAFRAMMRNKTSAVSGPPPFPVDAIRHTAPAGSP
jgi:ribosomal protein L32